VPTRAEELDEVAALLRACREPLMLHVESDGVAALLRAYREPLMLHVESDETSVWEQPSVWE
jgi:hypothetical protein